MYYVHTKSNFIFSRQQPNLRSLHNYKKNELLVRQVSSVRRVELLAGSPGELFKTRRLSLVEVRTARCTVEAFQKLFLGSFTRQIIINLKPLQRVKECSSETRKVRAAGSPS